MASSNRKGKGRSTDWSDYLWDSDQQIYYKWRYGPTGEAEYSYPPPDTNAVGEQTTAPSTIQTSVQGPAVPRYTGDENSYSSEATSHVEQDAGGSYTTSSTDTRYPLDYQDPSRSSYPASRPNDYIADAQGSRNYPSYNNDATYAVSNDGLATLDSSANTSALSYRVPPATSSSSGGVAYSWNGTTPISSYTTPASLDRSFQGLSLGNIPEQGSFNLQSRPPPPIAGVSHIRATPNSNSYEDLDRRYKVVEEKNQQKFWKVGRVFMMLWTEPARTSGTSRDGTHFSTTWLNGTAFSEIRRFVVIKQGYGNNICSPIHTYGGQATLKANLPGAEQHAIIHTSDKVPYEKWYKATDGTTVQENLVKDPIRVKSEQSSSEGDLGDTSRLNYSKIYTVENYVRVLNIGMVHQNSMQSLLENAMVRQGDEPPRRPRDMPPRARDSTSSSRADSYGDEYQSSSRSRQHEKKHSSHDKRRSKR